MSKETTRCKRCGKECPTLEGKFGDFYRCDTCGIEMQVADLPEMPPDIKTQMAGRMASYYPPFAKDQPEKHEKKPNRKPFSARKR